MSLGSEHHAGLLHFQRRVAIVPFDGASGLVDRRDDAGIHVSPLPRGDDVISDLETCVLGEGAHLGVGDFTACLGFEVEGVDENLSALDASAYKGMVEKVVRAYPNLKVVGTTLREVKSGLVNNWSAILWHEGQFYESRRYENLEIEDRVGGGDGFSAGFVYGFMNGKGPQECVELGAALGALVQTTRGDTSQVDLEELMHVAWGGSARIKR